MGHNGKLKLPCCCATLGSGVVCGCNLGLDMGYHISNHCYGFLRIDGCFVRGYMGRVALGIGYTTKNCLVKLN